MIINYLFAHEKRSFSASLYSHFDGELGIKKMKSSRFQLFVTILIVAFLCGSQIFFNLNESLKEIMAQY